MNVEHLRVSKTTGQWTRHPPALEYELLAHANSRQDSKRTPCGKIHGGWRRLSLVFPSIEVGMNALLCPTPKLA